MEFLNRHQSGEWGECEEADRAENELSVSEGFRIFSVYLTSAGDRIWIITEAERSSTGIFLPDESRSPQSKATRTRKLVQPGAGPHPKLFDMGSPLYQYLVPIWGESEDRAYVLMGDAVSAGLFVEALFTEAHRSSMIKEPDSAGLGKAVKRRSYKPQDISGLLNRIAPGIDVQR